MTRLTRESGRQERTVPEEMYAFQHVLLQEAIYESLPQQQRVALHGEVGAAIEALNRDAIEEQYERLAFHYERSSTEEKAIDYLLKAGKKSQRAYLSEAAIGYYERALARIEGITTADGRTPPAPRERTATPAPTMEASGRDGTPPRPDGEGGRRSAVGHRRLEALSGLARSYQSVGRLATAEECFRQAVALGEGIGLPTSERAQLHHQLGQVLPLNGGYDEVVRFGEAALALLGEDAETVEAALILDLLALGSQMTGRWARWEALLLRIAGFIERLPYNEELRPVYLHLVPWAELAGRLPVMAVIREGYAVSICFCARCSDVAAAVAAA